MTNEGHYKKIKIDFGLNFSGYNSITFENSSFEMDNHGIWIYYGNNGKFFPYNSIISMDVEYEDKP